VDSFSGLSVSRATSDGGALLARAASPAGCRPGSILQQTPGYSIAEVRQHHDFDRNSPFKVAGVTESLIRGLRLAGLPE
jgi:hypothetical protein